MLMDITKLCCLICILVGRGHCQIEDDQFNGVYFQNDGIPSTDSFIASVVAFPQMDEISICTHFKVVHVRGDNMLLASYSVEQFPDEMYLSYGLKDDSVHFICCKGEGRYDSEPLNITNELLTAVHICIIIDLKNKKLTYHLNNIMRQGPISIVGESSSIFIQGGGILVLGQEQDETLGGFSISQSFEGYLFEYVLDNALFDSSTIRSLLECQIKPSANSLISFNDLENKWTLHGSVNIVQYSDSKICQENTKYFVVFPELLPYRTAFSLCNMLKGKVVVPINEIENEMVVRASENITSVCSTDIGIYMWIGVKAKNNNNNWEMVNEANDQQLPYSNFRPGFTQIHGDHKCAFFDVYQIGSWIIHPCTYMACVTCSFEQPIPLRLRGLCTDSLIDRKYYLSGYSEMKPKLEGISHSKIIYQNGSWILIDTVYKNIQATMVAEELIPYPFGLRQWTIYGDVCKEVKMNLLLTSCQSHQFTCNDGTCIPKMQRCDLQVQCPDLSDETLCTVVVVPTNYIKQVPPARIGKDPVSISILMTILAIHPIETLSMKLKMEVLITLRWRDPRLDMESLNYEDSMNVIHLDNTVWQPLYQMEDASGSETQKTLHWETFSAVMESGPLADDITRAKEDEVYPGSSNSLKLVQSYSIEYSCRMNLVGYPFDTQHCSLVIRLQDVPKDFVVLQAKDAGVEFIGTRGLREYFVTNAMMTPNNRGNFSGYMVTVSLDNLSGFYVFSTYIPTFLMVVICYSTFYFSLDDFNDRIMVSLTALLVLATLFTQITQTTPKTAYLKLLDVWFVSCILIDFFIVVLHVSINVVKLEEETTDPISHVISYKKPLVIKNQFERTMKYNRWAKISVPILVLLFVLGYTIVSKAFVL